MKKLSFYWNWQLMVVVAVVGLAKSDDVSVAVMVPLKAVPHPVLQCGMPA
jgi:hypothetical protein